MKTQVGIIGAGPSGLLLSHLLHLQGIDSIIIESRSQDYVIGRVRAGVLEQGTVDVLKESGLGTRLEKEGLEHHGIELLFDGIARRIDFPSLTDGKAVTVYGQKEVVKDLIAARQAADAKLFFEAKASKIEGLAEGKPVIHFEKDGEQHTITCDYIAGCDGFHGISRKAIPDEILTVFEREYPFGWLGILAEAAPSSEELIYANTSEGFALHSMRSPTVTRNYIQCAPDDDIKNWTDDQIWETLNRRFQRNGESFHLNTGNIFEKGITAMRSFVTEPMRYEKLFLVGDAAHIVPPTGAKGMNLAISDVRVLAKALTDLYHDGSEEGIDTYSEKCLRRTWLVTRFSWWMTSMLHKFPQDDAFGHKIQVAQLDYATASLAAQTTLAENYVGLPLDL